VHWPAEKKKKNIKRKKKENKNQKVERNLLFYSLYYAEASNELAGSINAALR